MTEKLTTNSAKAWAPDVVAVPAAEALPESLIMQITTKVGELSGDEPLLRVPICSDDSATVVAEGSPIPESSAALNEVTIASVKVAHLNHVSNELFRQPNAPLLLSDAAARAVIRESDRVLLNQAKPSSGTSYPPAGLLTQAGITAKAEGNFDGIILALAQAQANGADPRSQKLVLSPDAWAALRLMKYTGTGESILGLGGMAVGGLETPTVLGMEVLTNGQMPKGTGFIVDTADAVSVYSDVRIAQHDGPFFSSDEMAIRTDFRFGGLLVHPDRHVKLSISSTAPAA